MDYQTLIRECCCQGGVLLKNDDNTLPFSKDDSISIFGRCQINYYKSGTGSGGSVHVPYSVNLLDGFENLKKENFAIPQINEKLVKKYQDWLIENPFDGGNGEWASEPWCQKEMELTAEDVKEAAAVSKKAVYIIGRTAGEDQDNKAEKGSFYLTDVEYENIVKICSAFESLTVVLNTSNIIDLEWTLNPELKGKVKAILYSWQGGMQGGQGLADLLCGKANPSGKLADTIALKISDYPSTKNFGSAADEIYEEDIYCGYRYFTTFAKEKVMFPFGFGLSYTSFDISGKIIQVDSQKLVAEVLVKNTGSRAGRETVQIYVRAPQGKLGKPLKVLAAYKKTDLIEAGKDQTVLIDVPLENFSSYDDSGISGFAYSYVLEEGEYSVFAGSDCFTENEIFDRNNKRFAVNKTYSLVQLSQNCAPEINFKRIKPGVLRKDGTYEILEEAVPLSKTDIAKKIEEHQILPVENKASAEISFSDVVKDKSLADQFVAGLSDNELMTIVRGEGMMSRKVTAGIASAFGGVSQSLNDKGLPAVGCADGPSGIRMDNGKEANLVPIGTLLACTWNPSLVEELFKCVGKELIEKNIDVLLGPGCNIHRNPLNGRNFEYFSEDPLITGDMAAGVCKGLASEGAIGTIKHFAMNNQESHRRTQNSVASERAVREIYLKPFEIAVKKGNARSIMTSYNGINGHKSASNFELNVCILRDEWNYTGVVMTDWWAAMNDCVKGGDSTARNLNYMVKARNNLYMVVVNDTAETGGFGDNLEEELKKGSVSKAELQKCVKDIILFITETNAAKKPLRPLKNEIVAHNKISGVPAGQKVYKIWESASDNLNEGVYYEVEKTGVYTVNGTFIKDGKDTLSQSVTNVLVNDEILGSFECRSTDGKVVSAAALQLSLNKGFYKLSLEHTKPGIEVINLCLASEGDSPITSGVYE